MILSIIESIANESSSNGKLAILKQHKDNEVLKMVLQYAYSPMYNFYTKHQIDVVGDASSDPIYMDFGFAVFSALDKLAARQVTGNAAIEFLDEIGYQLEKEDRVVLNKIIARDLDMGMATKSINKVFSNLIPTVPYMRCSLTDKLDKISYPAMVQQKCDGMFVNVVMVGGNAHCRGTVKFLTRNGTEFDLVRLGSALKSYSHSNLVFHGELLILKEDGDVEDRKIGNGMINSLIKQDQTLESLDVKYHSAKTQAQKDKIQAEMRAKVVEFDSIDQKVQLVLWDCVGYGQWLKGEDRVSYSLRFIEVNKLVQNVNSKYVKVVESLDILSYHEAQAFYLHQIRNGYEGAVLKNLKGYWKNHTSPEQIKLKAEKECELVVIGVEAGQGKYTGKIGSLICESSDKLLRVNVGSGLTDVERETTYWDIVGKIISVKFNEVIQSDSKDTYSLFLPRFVEIRTDKNEADTLAKIKLM